MLDRFIIFGRNGVVYFDKQFVKLRGDPLSELILDVLLENRNASSSTTSGQYTLKWTFDTAMDLVFVAVYQKSLKLAYVEDMLSEVQRVFAESTDGELDIHGYQQFEPTFIGIWKQCEGEYLRKPVTSAASPANTLAKTSKEDTKAAPQESKASKKKGKEMRSWGDKAVDATELDYSNSTEQNGDRDFEALVDRKAMESIKKGSYEVPEMEDVQVKSPSSASSKSWMSYLSSFASGKAVTEENLEPVIRKMKEQLVQKNVAKEVTDTICESVATALLGTRIGTFESLTNAIKKNLEEALRRVLTPRSSSDILREVYQAKRDGNPYSISFIGVNGVGKSTNLSKVCFWLLQNKLSVLIAACDTFRSGAVEQLKVHIRNLKRLDEGARVEIFEQGYGKDAATIAKDAIQFAKQERFDVVLIDTAGRMQNNEPLMRALAKLVAVNSPDKVVFVGEALVGNEAVDQLTKFNKALQDYSGQQNPRQIDGIILTKFDTVDDKVGAAVTMSFVTGKPIFFVGTGQTYTDLKRLNITQIVSTLLS